MPNLKELKNRQVSVKATQKITRAMQMVAAAKLNKAQESAQRARPYVAKISNVMSNLLSSVDEGSAPQLMIGNGADNVHLLVVATADRGLCGAFNTNIVKLANQEIKTLLSNGKQVKILCVGKKGYDLLRRNHSDKIIDFISLKEVKNVSFNEAELIGGNILKRFEEGEFDVCKLFYSNFKSVISQIPLVQQLIPLAFEAEQHSDEASLSDNSIYDYEPEESDVIEELLPLNLKVQIFQGLLENAASEQGSRMSAMDNATRNAGEMINKLTLQYNRTRQAIITKELIEIISGAEAL
ncbi:MAG: F0F1 ATP synthase subunit gamma [Rhodobiaceae bacterium]|nr:F0F1 ATP synthase subunit gamma [Rhodobiaceae bacterium]RPF97426.1 MAG: F0F1 ATP synthase subunit gamma [Rhizobiales bacterium TMED227]